MPDPHVAATLVLGGARSGKSRHAEALARQTGLARFYIATGVPFDDEMTARIARHRQDRAQDGWTTVEAPLDLATALRRDAAPERIVLVDCLTLWLSNLMLGGHDVDEAVATLGEAVATLAGPAIFVSNEVGFGIVPETALGRAFRDAQGRLNQRMAELCTRAVLVVAGLPLVLKGAG